MRKIRVKDRMQTNYSYELKEPVGKNFDKEFKPDLTPKEMLEKGVFGGLYLADCQDEFPKEWFKGVKMVYKDVSSEKNHDPQLNFFKINASQPLSVWREKGWLYKDDPRGWFQWYCRYYMGRRIPEEDKRQIKRWKAIRRHVSQLRKNCKPKDLSCRSKQRQSLLHWAYDSTKI